MVIVGVARILDTVGKTPLIEVEGIYAKLETYNPSGSVKDRMVNYMIKEAIRKGELTPGQKIIEITSGNTGISLAMHSAILGYEFTAVMPESMSLERRRMLESFGAKLVLTPKEEDMGGALRKYQELVEQNPDAWLPKQFENPDNYLAHEKGLAQEIIAETGGKIDVFVAGAGSGGTIIGVARALKQFNPNIKIVAVEPAESAVLSGDQGGLHKIQGIGEGFIPKVVKDNLHLIDEVIKVKSDDAIEMSKHLTKRHGILVGYSSGANFIAAKRLQERFNKVITVFADRGERYLS